MILAALAIAAAFNFVTPEMTLRRGLTDEQYEYLWAIGKNPQVDQTTARSWMFQSSRYSNVTNWLDIVGKSNDFARLSFTLQQQNFDLEATNDVVVAERDAAISLAESWEWRYEGATNTLAATSNLLSVTSGQLSAANAKIQGEISFLNQMKALCDQLVQKYPLQAEEILAIKAQFEQRIVVLSALTSP